MTTILGVLVVASGGLIMGSGAWPFKLMRKYQFEHWWFVGMLVAPKLTTSGRPTSSSSALAAEVEEDLALQEAVGHLAQVPLDRRAIDRRAVVEGDAVAHRERPAGVVGVHVERLDQVRLEFAARVDGEHRIGDQLHRGETRRRAVRVRDVPGVGLGLEQVGQRAAALQPNRSGIGGRLRSLPS